MSVKSWQILAMIILWQERAGGLMWSLRVCLLYLPIGTVPSFSPFKVSFF